MPDTELATSAKTLAVAELRRLPIHERNAILAVAAEAALDDYTNDPELTAFEAFGEEDIYGDSSDTRPR